jgi:hypothetical protein
MMHGSIRVATHLERRPWAGESGRALALATGRLGSGMVEDAHVGTIGRELDAGGVVARVGGATARGVAAREDGGGKVHGLTAARVLRTKGSIAIEMTGTVVSSAISDVVVM